MTSRIVVAVGALVVLAGCAESIAVTQPPVDLGVKPSSAERQIFGFTEPVVRAYIKEDGNRKEVAGARCKMDSAEFAGSAITPAMVRMPIVKGRPTAMNITCTTPKYSGTTRFTPSLQGTAVGGASTAGLVAAVISTAIVAGRDRWAFSGDGGRLSVEMLPKSQ